LTLFCVFRQGREKNFCESGWAVLRRYFVSNNLTSKQFWQEKWKFEDYQGWSDGSDNFVPEWHNILYGELTAYQGGDCLEVGCFPGRYLRYFERVYGMRAEGVDLMAPDENAVTAIHQCDFFEFRSDKKYDVVCSFGFIEHFEVLDDVIQRHVDLVKEGGMVVITVPNFVHGWRFCARRKHDKELFVHHNRNAMVLGNIENILKNLKIRRYKLSPVRFSDKSFLQVSGVKRIIGKSVAALTRFMPPLDQGLATEILIVLYK